MFYTIFKTDYSDFLIVGDKNTIYKLHFITSEKPEIDKSWIKNEKRFEGEIKQINEYFEGKRKDFDINFKLEGTEFQKKVWNELYKIPYSKVKSYKDIAIAIGNPKAARAIGMACNKNPIPIIVPCHRVIGSNGKLVGFAPGTDLKRQMLTLENKTP